MTSSMIIDIIIILLTIMINDIIYDIINYCTSICPFESGKCGKEGNKLQKIEYLEKEKNFLDEIKNIFHSF